MVLAILRSLAAVVRRDLAGYGPIRTNNFFLFVALLMHAGLRPERWRFSGGRVLFGALQMIAGATLAFAGVIGATVAVVIWGSSVWWGGSVLPRRFRR